MADDSQHDQDFVGGSAGASNTFPIQVSTSERLIHCREREDEHAAVLWEATRSTSSLVRQSLNNNKADSISYHVLLDRYIVFRPQEGSSRCDQGTTLQDHRSVLLPSSSSSPPLLHTSQLTMPPSSFPLSFLPSDMSTSKTGKHGHAKVHLIATDVSTTPSSSRGKEGARCQLALFSGH